MTGIREEAGGANLGDRRLDRRLVQLAEVFARAPDLSFPKATGDEAELEATYRFLKNPKVTPDGILEPHHRATVQRCAQAGLVVVCHDTTEFRFSTDREGLGRISTSDHGFLGHFALAVDPARRAPLGVLGLTTLFRETPPSARRRKKPLPERESMRWPALVSTVEQRLGHQAAAIHVMDREADAYEALALMVEAKQRFVVRLQFDRMVDEDGDRVHLGEVMAEAKVVLAREVQLSERRPGPRDPPSRAKKHPLRKARTAKLEVTSRSVRLLRPTHVAEGPSSMELAVVQVREVDAPADASPVEWRLVTTEPVATPEQVEAVIDAYRLRWTIEEYFKALKTGCAYEKRQLETRAALLNALALFTSIAWLLLAIRSLARDQGQTPASQVLSPLKLRILEGHKRTKLRPEATIRDALLAIAALGGHIRNNGEPGWLVLGRGLQDLLLLEQGAAIALGCDQS